MEKLMPVLKTENEWLTPAEAAEYLRVAHSTIYRWAKSGVVTLYRVGDGVTRIKRSEVEALARHYLGHRLPLSTSSDEKPVWPDCWQCDTGSATEALSSGVL